MGGCAQMRSSAPPQFIAKALTPSQPDHPPIAETKPKADAMGKAFVAKPSKVAKPPNSPPPHAVLAKAQAAQQTSA